jgi:alpha-D-xyloside xylohydrolase
MDFPADERAHDVRDQYLFGHSFMVAPVHQHGARARDVYLPAGTGWYDFNSGTVHEGGRTVTVAAPLARMPVFVRAGSIVPTGPEIQYTAENPQGPITLLVFTGADGRFELYEDDGVSYGYERGEFSRIPLSYDDAAGKLTIGARTGRYAGMSQRRVIRVRWIGPGAAAPSDFNAKADNSLDYDGAEVVVMR